MARAIDLGPNSPVLPGLQRVGIAPSASRLPVALELFSLSVYTVRRRRLLVFS
jgi:hypothetical protein